MMDETTRPDPEIERFLATLATVTRPLAPAQAAPFAALLAELETGSPGSATVWAALQAVRKVAASGLAPESPADSTGGWSALLQPLPGLGSSLSVSRDTGGTVLRFRLDTAGTPCGAITLEGHDAVGVLEIGERPGGLMLQGFAGDRELSVPLGEAPKGCWTSKPVVDRLAGDALLAGGAGSLAGLFAKRGDETPPARHGPAPPLPMPPPEPAAPASVIVPTHALSLVFHSGPTAVEPVTLTGRVVVGRERDCDLRLDDPGVSRHHAAVEPTPEGARVTDLGSSNGTYLNRRRIEAPVKAREGDEIVVGHTHLVLAGGPRAVPKVSDGPAQSPEPAPVPPATPFQPPETSPRHCRRCGRPEPDAAMRFCCACGQPLEAATPAVPPSCASCGRELHPGERFCTSCGRKVG